MPSTSAHLWPLMNFAPFPRHKTCGPGSRTFAGTVSPGLASPSTFPSQGFSPPQGFTSRISLWPCFMPLPRLGFVHLRSFSHSGSRNRLRSLTLLILQDNVVFEGAWIHRSELDTIQHLAMPLCWSDFFEVTATGPKSRDDPSLSSTLSNTPHRRDL